jgi:hypothetical protein
MLSSLEKDENVKERLDAILSWIQRQRCDSYYLSTLNLNAQCAMTYARDLLEALKSSSTPEERAAAERVARIKECKVVAWRGVLTKLLCTPFAMRDQWAYTATLVDGVMYLHEMVRTHTHTHTTST